MTSLKNRSTFQTSEELQKRGEAIRLQMSQGVNKPSEKMTDISSGDIHTAGMKPITFVRQVLAGCLYPDLLSSDTLPHDARVRAQKLLEQCHGGSVGAYAESCGMDRVRRTVANFITARDGGLPSNPDNICIASGSLRALTVILKLLAQGDATLQTGVMIPVPYPHTLLPILDRVGSVPLPYILGEQTGWRIEKAELDRALQASKSHCWPRAIYISNPGNPTGHVQSRESIQEVIKFAAEQNLFVLADEVYQDTVFGEETEFVSYKKVLAEMGPPYSHTVQMASVNSLSNGIMGECGFRTGYMELVNVDESMMLYVETLLCGDISTLVIGQLALDIMADPPHPGDPSYDLYKQEVESRQHTLKSNMRRAAEIFNTLPGFHCIPPQSGIFICPHLRFSHTALGHVQELGVEAGQWYCERLLEEEGLCVAMYECTCDRQSLDCVPGSNWHLRLCVLMPFETLEQVLSQLQAFHHRFLKAL